MKYTLLFYWGEMLLRVQGTWFGLCHFLRCGEIYRKPTKEKVEAARKLLEEWRKSEADF